MSNEQREAFKIAEGILPTAHLSSPSQIQMVQERQRQIAAALLEARADGIDITGGHHQYDADKAASLRAEAATLREKT